MKNTRLVLAMLFALQLFTFTAQNVHAQEGYVSYQTFYDQLAPYGQWVYDGQYGHVWVPNVEPGFRPYATDGHWVMTDQGNMWASDEPWAWACYHYGRWTYNGYYGWVWLPGYQWAPAWVMWRSGGGYYGWAPMGPGHEFGNVYEYPESYWVFVNPNYLYHPQVYTYYEHGDSRFYYRQTTYYRYEGHDNYYYGPRREVYERETHQPVEVYRISDAREAGPARMDRHEVNIYRPAVNRETEHSARPAQVVEGRDHPIRQEPISPNHETVHPAFRQEHAPPPHQQVVQPPHQFAPPHQQSAPPPQQYQRAPQPQAIPNPPQQHQQMPPAQQHQQQQPAPQRQQQQRQPPQKTKEHK